MRSLSLPALLFFAPLRVHASNQDSETVDVRVADKTQTTTSNPPEAGAPTPNSDALLPPRLLSSPPLHYPATANGQGVRVLLELTIDSTGSVEVASVVTPANPDFDAAALAAAKQYRFEPATRNGQALRSRLRLAFDFAPLQASGETANTAKAGVQSSVATPDASDANHLVAAARQQTDPPKSATATEVLVQGVSKADSLKRSAYAVEVVELGQDARLAGDLGMALSQRSSLSVRREGGLGSAGRYALGGLAGERIRFFLNGLPLELTGYAFGLANVPVNLIERAEVYQGVVPVRFGADALGGAVNLVTTSDLITPRAGFSYEFGSFGTHRATFAARGSLPKSGLFGSISGFFDTSRNDYPIDVEVTDDKGSLSAAEVRRFHDGYRGLGATLSAGVVNQPWADKLVVSGFFSDYRQELQSNAAMTVPYGQVSYGRWSSGANLTFTRRPSRNVRVDLVTGYAFRETHFRDVSNCRYDWYGRCFFQLPTPGEVDSIASDRNSGDHSFFLRTEVTLTPFSGHTFRIAAAPTLQSRSGRDRALLEGRYDPLRAERKSTAEVFGAEYQLDLMQGRVSNILFAKAYKDTASSEERLASGELQRLKQENTLFGGGDSYRLLLAGPAYFKASYEYAVRLPTADERFGDGALLADNIELKPERSHNGNLGLYLDSIPTPLGSFRAELIGSARIVQDYILRERRPTYEVYSNLLDVRALSAEASASWTSPAEFIKVQLRGSVQDARNTTSDGAGAKFAGDRLLNQPYRQGSVVTRLRQQNVLLARDALELNWSARYVHEFFRGWESAGLRSAKQVVPTQLTQNIALTHTARGDHSAMSNSFEVQNLTDEKVYDFYGVQRPGRSYHWKLTIDY